MPSCTRDFRSSKEWEKRMFDGIDPNDRPERPEDERIARLEETRRILEKHGRAFRAWRDDEGGCCIGQAMLLARGIESERWRIIKLRLLPETPVILMAARHVTRIRYTFVPTFNDNSSDEVVAAVIAEAIALIRAGTAPAPERGY